MNVHLIDGTYELFRSYYGNASRKSATGREIGAVHGLVRTLLALLAEPGVTHVAVAFDHVIESFRNALFAGYKTGAGMDAALWGQFQPAEDACRALGLVVWPMIEFECDDALATAAERFTVDARVERVVVCSPDKDLAQCVRGTRVVCLDRARRKVFTEEAVLAKFGVMPASIPDWLALVGDAADGYPGIARWGPKSAAAVLAHYEHIEAIPQTSSEWRAPVRGASALAEQLAAHYEEALLYRQLATLRTDVPIAESLEELRWRGPGHGFDRLAAEWRDDKLIERVAHIAAR